MNKTYNILSCYNSTLMKENLSKITNSIKKASSSAWNRSKKFMVRFPVWSTVIILAFLLVVIAAANMVRKPAPAPEPKKPVKAVSVYSIGEAPRIRAQAQIEKSGVIKIVAQTSGIVQNIRFKEGQEVSKGSTLANVSTNYQGGTALSVQRQIAEKQYFNVRDTFDSQKEIIGKQREIADKTDENSDKLREISEKSIGDTKSILELNNTILNTLNTDLAQLEATNSGNMNKNAITALQQSKLQLLSSANSLNSSIRTLEYTVATDSAQARLSDLNKDLVKKQLDVQEQALTLNKEVSHLQYSLALINESLAYPAAPCAGIIEKVHVKFGQAVNPGDILFTLSTNEKSALAIALVSQDVAYSVSRFEPSLMTVRGKTLSLIPSYVSQEATDGTLYSVYYALPEEFISDYGNDSYIDIEIPIGYADTSAAIPYIPLDAVHQTQEGAFVYVSEKGVAKGRKVQLGTVFGQYVEIKNGLKSSDQIILDRNVIDNEKIKANTI